MSVVAVWLWRIVIAALCGVGIYVIYLSHQPTAVPLLGFVLAGVYLRNSPFGAPYIKVLCLAAYIRRTVNIAWDDDGSDVDLRYAGRKTVSRSLRRYDIRSFGVVPSSGVDQTALIQEAIDSVGRSGGGVVFFPKGRYLVNTRGDSFLHIDFSDITLAGEVDGEGHPLAEIVCCGPTTRGVKNPWLSPFMITTGELLQPSNEFWGIDLQRRQAVLSRSNSLSDPGSDGSILSAVITTRVTAAARRGDSVLHVAKTQGIGKYILVGMYNTSSDGNLLHELLGMDTFRSEWTLCHRAGQECAASWQWLVEVKEIADDGSLVLCRPLLHDISMEYCPVVCAVEMLEHIVIRDLRLTSRWNGMFRHHGFPLYYSVRQTQEMDYGWNAINMKRVAHGEVSNVVIENFTNPIYVMDSRNVTVEHVRIGGYDGHQGIKLYMHACDNLFADIVFTSHYADMMGGEGNAYGNVFTDISYRNPVFHPVDYDFHGFGEVAMSPPGDNIFTHIYGFRYIKHAGAITHMPSSAQGNTWIHTISEGERQGEPLFYNMAYRERRGALRLITAVGYAVVHCQRQHYLSPMTFVSAVRSKLADIDSISTPKRAHAQFIPTSIVVDLRSQAQY